MPEALRLCTRLRGRRPERRMLNRVTGYLGFLEFAHRSGIGGFHNFLSYQRQWLDAEGCGDCRRGGLFGPGRSPWEQPGDRLPRWPESWSKRSCRLADLRASGPRLTLFWPGAIYLGGRG